MNKLTYVNPENFESINFEFEPFHMEIVKTLKNSIKEKIENIITSTEIMTDNKGESLIFGIIKRTTGKDAEKYKITIEKL